MGMSSTSGALQKELLLSKSRSASNPGFAKRIKQLRMQKSMNAAALARLLDVTPAAIWTWEKKGSTPRESTLDAIAKAFDTSKEFLVTGKKAHEASINKMTSPPLAPSNEWPLEELMRAIEAKGFLVSVRLKPE
jgi:transcriptional regulator with XRE-family HTH domain